MPLLSGVWKACVEACSGTGGGEGPKEKLADQYSLEKTAVKRNL